MEPPVAAQPGLGHQGYDIFYCDDRELSWEAEDRVIRLVEETVADLPIRVEVRNQARVHLWYRERFGISAHSLARRARALTVI
jgi:hypothetical protein